MIRRIVIGCMLLCVPLWAYSQGHVLLVGGGSEDLDAGGWSEAPYGWVVSKAENKRIAVISVNDETDVIPGYFVALGATEAHNIKIDTRALAEDAALYDSLMGYDGFFFKGGDQSRYYETWKDSEVTRAMADKFAEGGVLAGTSAGLHILSGVIFTAEVGSVYPEQGLEDIGDEDFTLRSDFTQNLPGYLFDSHFIERGRSLRLLSFLAHRLLTTGETLVGMGVDDQTALAIDAGGLATVYGTAGVELIWADSTTLEAVGNQFATRGWRSQRLLAGDQRQLRGDSLRTFTGTENTTALLTQETSAQTVYLMGGEEVAVFEEIMTEVMADRPVGTHVVVVHSDGTLPPSGFRTWEGATLTTLATSEANNADRAAGLRNALRQAEVLVWVGNKMASLTDFMAGGPTGALLQTHLHRSEVAHIFVGEDSKLAGAMVVTNNRLQANASYRGDLDFAEGLSLLETTVVMPNAIDLSTSDYYENTVSAVPWALTQYQLRYGLYLNENSYLRYHTEEDTTQFLAYGQFAAVVQENTSTRGGRATQRNVVAYDEMQYTVLPEGHSLSVGVAHEEEPESYAFELEPPHNLVAMHEESSVQLMWEDPNTLVTAAGYAIERAEGATDSFQALGTTTDLSYTDDQIAEGTAYRYQIRATNADTVSAWSEPVQVEVVTGLATERAPFLLYPNPISGNELTLQGSATPTHGWVVDALGQKVAVAFRPLESQRWKVMLPPGSGPQWLCFVTQDYSQHCLPVGRKP